MTDDHIADFVRALREAVINTIGIELEDSGGASWHHHEHRSWEVVREKLSELLRMEP